MKEKSEEELKKLHEEELQAKLRVIAAIKPYGDLLFYNRQQEKYENLNVLSEMPSMTKLLENNRDQAKTGRNVEQENALLYNNLVGIGTEQDALWLQQKIIAEMNALDIKTINSLWQDILTKAQKKLAENADKLVFYNFLLKYAREQNPLPPPPPVAAIPGPVGPPGPAGPAGPPAAPLQHQFQHQFQHQHLHDPLHHHQQDHPRHPQPPQHHHQQQ